MTTYDLTDPDQLSLLLVMQYLSEQGYPKALSALESECGLLYDDSKITQGHQLMQLVWQHVESQMALEVDAQEVARRLEEEQLLNSGKADFASEAVATVEDAHSCSVLCVQLWPQQPWLITGGGDGFVRCVTFDDDVRWAMPLGGGGVLTLDLGLEARGTSDRQIVAGGMSGVVSVLDAASGDVIANKQVHSKYLVRAAWSRDGGTMATCSYDQTVAFHRLIPAGAEDGGSGEARIETLKQVSFLTAVQDVAFLHDGVTLAVVARDSNYLRLFDTSTFEERLPAINLNARGDDHLSFYGRHLVPSPCGRYLLVSTDGSRLLVLRTSDWSHLRDLFGLATEQFHQPAAAWHRDSAYVYAAAAGAQVWVYHVGKAQVVAKLPAHKINVRNLHYDAERNLLATASFDKAVKVFGAPKSSSASTTT